LGFPLNTHVSGVRKGTEIMRLSIVVMDYKLW